MWEADVAPPTSRPGRGRRAGSGVSSSAVLTDVSQPEAVDRLAREAVAAFGSFDGILKDA